MCRKITQTTLSQYIGKLGGIDRAATIEKFGYDPDTLSRGSARLVVAVCERCGIIRHIRKNCYHDLCHPCAHKKYYEDHPNARKKASITTKKHFENPETREKMSVAKKKYFEKTPNARKKASVAARKHYKEHPETREKMSVASKKYYEDHPNARKKASITTKKHFENPETREKMSVAKKKYFEKTPNARKKASVAARKHYKEHPETREKMSVARKKYFEKNPNARKKMSVMKKKYFEDPETRETMRMIKKKYYEDPNARKRASVAIRKHYKEHPETREKMSMAKKKYFEDPEGRKRYSAAQQHIPYEKWEAFACDQKYCPAFNEACRESNREKYGRRCFICGLPESENVTKRGEHRKLAVHHIDLNKMQGCDGYDWRLIPTCLQHHDRTIHTPLWVGRITYLLQHKI